MKVYAFISEMSFYLGKRENVIVIVTETTGATDELPKDDVADGIPAPTIGVSSFDLVGLFPALLFDRVRKASRVIVRVRVKVLKERSGGVDVSYGESGRSRGGGWGRTRQLRGSGFRTVPEG